MTESWLNRFDGGFDADKAAGAGHVPLWSDLDRQTRKAMSRVLGGGTLRAIAPETVQNLRRLGLIEGNREFAKLTAAGWDLLRSSREWLRSSPAASRPVE
jgi:hypothetical protein